MLLNPRPRLRSTSLPATIVGAVLCVVVFAASGKRAFSEGAEGTVLEGRDPDEVAYRVREMGRFQLQDKNGCVSEISVEPEGTRFACSVYGTPRRVVIFDSDSPGKPVLTKRLPPECKGKHVGAIGNGLVAWLQQEKGRAWQVAVWDTKKDEVRLLELPVPVSVMVADQTRKRLICGTTDGQLAVVDPGGKGVVKRRRIFFKRTVKGLRVSRSGQHLVAFECTGNPPTGEVVILSLPDLIPIRKMLFRHAGFYLKYQSFYNSWPVIPSPNATLVAYAPKRDRLLVAASSTGAPIFGPLNIRFGALDTFEWDWGFDAELDGHFGGLRWIALNSDDSAMALGWDLRDTKASLVQVFSLSPRSRLLTQFWVPDLVQMRFSDMLPEVLVTLSYAGLTFWNAPKGRIVGHSGLSKLGGPPLAIHQDLVFAAIIEKIGKGEVRLFRIETER